MVSRKMMVMAAVAVAVMMAAGQPAMAGVGGCTGRIGVGGCWQITVGNPGGVTLLALDSLRGLVRADLVAAMKALYEGKLNRGGLQKPGDTTTQGVGGCTGRIGVGGCWQ